MRRSTIPLALAAAMLLAWAVPLFAQPTPLLPGEPVDKLIAVLKSDAPQKDKMDACRQLGVIGTEDAVPVLVTLLGDEKLSHMARYALEPMPFPSVDEALRDALGKLKGRPLVGVIGSIGVRRDAKAVEPLARLLQDSDAEVVQATARALGRIGTSEAAKALQNALAGASAANQLSVCEGLFRAAEALADKGQREEAVAIYDRLRGLDKAPHQVRTGALRGAILARGNDGLPLLRENLRSKDYLLFAAAVATAQEMPDTDVTKALCEALPQLPPDGQIVVLGAIGLRGDNATLPAVIALAQSGPKPVRLAAIRTVAQINQGWVEVAKLIEDPDPDIAQAAQESLASLSCDQVDSRLLEMLGDPATSRRLIALDLIGRRRMTKAIPALLKAAGDADGGVRGAALRRLGELGGAAELPALLDALKQCKPEDLGAVEQAVGAVAARDENPNSCAEKLAAAMAGAQPAPKSALVRVLGTVGGAAALKAVRAAVGDANAEVHATAVRALSAWKTPDAVPDLLALAQNASDPTEKTLGLRAYLGWAANADLPARERLAMCRQAGTLAQKPEEKKLLLAALGGIGSLDALAMVMPQVDDAATRDEACAAAVSVAENLLKAPNAAQAAPKLIAPLEKVAQVTTNADLARRAKEALGQAKSKAGK